MRAILLLIVLGLSPSFAGEIIRGNGGTSSSGGGFANPATADLDMADHNLILGGAEFEWDSPLERLEVGDGIYFYPVDGSLLLNGPLGEMTAKKFLCPSALMVTTDPDNVGEFYSFEGTIGDLESYLDNGGKVLVISDP